MSEFFKVATFLHSEDHVVVALERSVSVHQPSAIKSLRWIPQDHQTDKTVVTFSPQCHCAEKIVADTSKNCESTALLVEIDFSLGWYSTLFNSGEVVDRFSTDPTLPRSSIGNFKSKPKVFSQVWPNSDPAILRNYLVRPPNVMGHPLYTPKRARAEDRFDSDSAWHAVDFMHYLGICVSDSDIFPHGSP